MHGFFFFPCKPPSALFETQPAALMDRLMIDRGSFLAIM
jgi:hypothetical protein